MSQLAAPDSLSGLPAELTGFVGRRHDRAGVRRLLSQSRLVTLTGFGGVGKTRLSLRLASELSRVYPDGVWFVPFGELSDPALMPAATAGALGIRGQYRTAEIAGLAESLRNRELLLVLDNCEHLIDDCALLVDKLLRAAPRLRILATSREPLRLDGEAIWPIAPLSVPPVENGASVEDSEAVRLFVERAGQVVPGFTLTEENRVAVVGICAQLDGIPLALELAAVRLRSMSPAELLDGLRRHWDLLSIGSRGAPARHRTMTACLEWSYALCSPEERELWALMSVFVGGVDVEAVRYVAAERHEPRSAQEVAALVQSLVDKSILTCEWREGRARYRMLEVLRRFGAGHLERTGQLRAARQRHRDWCIEVVKAADADFMSREQMASMRRLRREEPNLRLALEFCYAEPGEAETGLRLATRLRDYDVAYGLFAEGRLWLDRLLARVPDPGTTRLEGLCAAAWLAVMSADKESSAAFVAEARLLADDLGDGPWHLVDQAAGLHEMSLGNYPAAVDLLGRACDGFRAARNLRDQAETHTLLGLTYGFAGDLERSASSHQESLKISEPAGECLHRSYSQWHLGLVAWASGDPARGAELERESLALKRDMEDRLGVALCLEALAWIDANDDPRQAATLLGAADALWERMGTSLATQPVLQTLHDDNTNKLREKLGDRRFSEAFGEGASMTWRAMVAHVLDEKRPDRPVEDSTTIAAPELTPREHDVARLVAQGLSNKAIARTLVISPRTAEAHVEHILAKLGFTSRTQVAAWMAERDRGAGDR